MISVKNISKFFGSVRAVRDISFEIPQGEVVGLLGPNGAGKTTTIRMITGYLPPSIGEISVCGHDTIHDSIAARRLIGYLPEATPLYPEMRVWDYLLFRARLFGVPMRARRASIEKVVTRCWLADVHRRRIGQLSKGYKQRVGLAAALLHDPAVLILDEPSSGLDPTQILETRKLIRELSKNRTVLVSSHILPEVERTCDRVLIMARGQLRADGTPARLIADLQRRHPAIHAVEVLADTKLTGSGDAGDSTTRGQAGEIAKMISNLRTLPGITEVQLDTMTPIPDTTGQHGGGTHWFRLLLKLQPGQTDLREAIARELNKGSVLYRDLTRLTPTLENLFTSIIEEQDQTEGRAA